MAETLNFQQMATEIVQLVGGTGNIQSVSHCMTRLRFVLKSEDKADTAAIKKIKGVLGVVSAGGQYMVVLGKNLPPVFEAVQKQFNLTEGQNTDENLDKDLVQEKKPLTLKSAALAVLGYVSSAVSPMITGLVAGGMLKVLLLIITLIDAGFADTTTYTLLSGVADACFYFMPIFVAYGAAKNWAPPPSMPCSARRPCCTATTPRWWLPVSRLPCWACLCG